MTSQHWSNLLGEPQLLFVLDSFPSPWIEIVYPFLMTSIWSYYYYYVHFNDGDTGSVERRKDLLSSLPKFKVQGQGKDPGGLWFPWQSLPIEVTTQITMKQVLWEALLGGPALGGPAVMDNGGHC